MIHRREQGGRRVALHHRHVALLLDAPCRRARGALGLHHGRSTTAHALGEGSTLRVETPHPDVLLAAIDRADVGPLADALNAVGVSVSVGGPDGRVALIGSAASSRMGRILTGSVHTQVPRRHVLPQGSRPAAAVVAIAGLIALWIRTTRNRRTP